MSAFQSAACKIFEKFIPSDVAVFVDDLIVKATSRKLDDTMISPGIRKGVYELMELIEQVLKTAFDTGYTFSAKKTYLGIQVSQRILEAWSSDSSKDGPAPSDEHISKILDWNQFSNLTEIRGFLGAAGSFRN